jgi:serine/threonine protein kinase
MKLEIPQDWPAHLEVEFDVYKELGAYSGLPKIYWYGESCEYRVLVLELLGPTLKDLFNYCGRKFSLKTVLLLANQLIRHLHHIHDKGYIHRDLTPTNMMLGMGRNGNQVYVTDFGLAQEYVEEQRQNKSDYRPHQGVGTALFSSIQGHHGYSERTCLYQDLCADLFGIDLLPLDDMESLGYVLVYFLRGCLPWQEVTDPDGIEQSRLIREMKESMTAEELCEDLPDEFVLFFKHVKGARGRTKPNYRYLSRLFQDLFRRRGFENDDVFDWTILRFFECMDSEE